jgi:geranylgeranyl reductase family protein
MPSRYDAIIAGAGPAGATAAYFLGRAGKNVLVLEKERLPRYKACGGAISTHMLEQFPFSFEPVIRSRVNAVSYALGERLVTVPIEASHLRMVMRSEFDAFLLEHARAEIRTGSRVRAVQETTTGVKVETSSGEWLEADHLVAADGANSVIAHALGLRRKKTLVAALEIEANAPDATLRRFSEHPVLIIGEVQVGYLWIFPKGDHLSIGIGALHPRPGELQRILPRVMGRFGISIQGEQAHGHPVPIYTHPERRGSGHCLLAGDAAGLVDPFTGEGIRFAVQSGRLAAEAILAGHPEGYTAQIEHAIGRRHRLSWYCTRVFFKAQRASFAYGLRNPAVTRAMLDMLAGRHGYGRILLTLAASLPRFLLSEKAPYENAASEGTDTPVPE